MREALSAAALALAVSAGAAVDRRFEISPSSMSAGPLPGRLFAAVARTLAARGGDREPRHGMQDWVKTAQNPHQVRRQKDRCYDER